LAVFWAAWAFRARHPAMRSDRDHLRRQTRYTRFVRGLNGFVRIVYDLALRDRRVLAYEAWVLKRTLILV